MVEKPFFRPDSLQRLDRKLKTQVTSIFQLDLGMIHLLASALRFCWQGTFGMCFRKKGSLLDKTERGDNDKHFLY